jgi:hypothetical protein
MSQQTKVIWKIYDLYFMIKLLEHCLHVPIVKEIIFRLRTDMLNNNIYYFIIITKTIITKHVKGKHNVYDYKKTYL